MKFKAPEGAESANVGGQYFAVVDGVLETPDGGDYIALLASHGFVHFTEPAAAAEEPAADPAPMTKAELRAAAKLAKASGAE